jgi:hypothetical protein
MWIQPRAWSFLKGEKEEEEGVGVSWGGGEGSVDERDRRVCRVYSLLFIFAGIT